MKRRRTVGSVAGALMGVVIAGTALAGNFGSNTASYGTPAHACDTDASSQCIADNGVQLWYPSNVTADLLAATRYASTYVYDPVADVYVFEWSSSDYVDVIVMDDPNNLQGIIAWTECADGATTGGTDPNAYCRPQWLRYDLADTEAYNSPEERRAIACQEMGHTLGLRHSSSTSSCMYTYVTTQQALVQHDIDELNAHY